MTDWEKLKVTDLKEELKSRGVPLTGLKLKQQLIDKLNELDASINSEGARTEHDEEHNREESVDTNEDDEKPIQDNAESGKAHEPEPQGVGNLDTDSSTPIGKDGDTPGSSDQTTSIKHSDAQQVGEAENNSEHIIHGTDPSETEQMDNSADVLPAELKMEDSQARDGATPPLVEPKTEIEEAIFQKDDPLITQDAQEELQDNMVLDGPETTEVSNTGFVATNEQGAQLSSEAPNLDAKSESTSDLAASTHAPIPEILDDQWKRKRRSLTPAPDADEVAHKKSRTNDGTPVITKTESANLKGTQQVTTKAQIIRDSEGYHHRLEGKADEQPMGEAAFSTDQTPADRQATVGPPPVERQQLEAAHSPSHSSPDRDVSPAIHPATCSLYIRNFKRPLHIPSLRSHISTLAKSTDEDPVTLFYLDTIRTHAFITFASISVASRVRNAMHGTRFPDEPMREPLWIDFAPDDKIQAWIDQESESGRGGLGGGRGSSKKYEVVYHDSSNGIEAILQEASNTNMQSHRPDLQQPRLDRKIPQDLIASTALASGLHPSRASQRVQSPQASHSLSQRPQPPPRPSDPGKGFRALDELFSSTTAKPKLYFKLPSQSKIDERQEMIRDLRVNHDQMGQSGDEGMKRYTFENDERSGREEWVDKGPEFGFGRRGQERLSGFGTSYGRGRGRGGFRGSRRGGDSWRGG